jgi:hypothetical protein
LGEYFFGIDTDGNVAAASALFVNENNENTKKKDEVNMMVRNNGESILLDKNRVIDFTMVLYTLGYFLLYLK